MDKLNVKLALDSGAHSLYKLVFSRSDSGEKILREHVSFEYVSSEQFKKYLDGYIAFLHKEGKAFDFYVNLDIIMSAEKSWEVQGIMEQAGLHPLPVFHLNEPWEFWKKYVDKYDYVGLGGLGQDIPMDRFMPFGDKAFDYILDKKNGGKPRVKIHGFAVNAVDVLKRYPYYSIDASSWTTFSRNGVICVPVPIWKNKKVIGFDYLKPPYAVPVGDRSQHKTRHLINQFELPKRVIEQYVRDNGFELDSIKDYWARDILNIKFYLGVEKAIKELYKEKWNFEEGGNLYFAGQPAAGSTLFTLKRISVLFPEGIRYLPTYFYKKHMSDLMTLKRSSSRKRFVN